jgi:hypothetical protein
MQTIPQLSTSQPHNPLYCNITVGRPHVQGSSFRTTFAHKILYAIPTYSILATCPHHHDLDTIAYSNVKRPIPSALIYISTHHSKFHTEWQGACLSAVMGSVTSNSTSMSGWPPPPLSACVSMPTTDHCPPCAAQPTAAHTCAVPSIAPATRSA